MALTYSEAMDIGTKAPVFELQDYSGASYSLSTLIRGKKGILVVFTCNHCPYAKASWPLLVELSQKFPDIQFVAINSNDPADYPEDSPAGMRATVEEEKISFPYLVDRDQSVAKAYKAVCTPDPFLFQVQETLRQPDLSHPTRSTQDDTSDLESLSGASNKTSLFYHGRINDNWEHPDRVEEENLKDAIEELLGGYASPVNQPPSMGCSIKWKK